jgi:protein phosphatase PTC7
MLGCNSQTPVNMTDSNIDSEVIGSLDSGSIVIPHPDKVEKGGEDAILVKRRLIAVADGVGGWIRLGVDAGEYSRELMRLIGEIYDKNPNATPKEILLEANKRTTKRGSSTLIIGILDPKNKKFATTAIGDSGYMIIRPKDKERYNILYR